LENDPNSRKDVVEILNHLGLTFFHQGEIDKAKSQWIKAANLSRIYRLPEMRAVSLRNLSRKELWETDNEFRIAYDASKEALRLARKSNRKDMPWFIHGHFSIANSVEKDPGKKSVLKEIVKEEQKQLKKVWKDTPKLERRVWLTGLIMDWAIYYNSISKPILEIGLFIAKMLNLKRREEQIKKLISEY
jgi:hypothetical protein